jgi:membrane protease subunit HflC
MNKLQANLIILGVTAMLVYLSLFVVTERELAIKFKLGEIIKSDYAPGLYWKVPLINNVRLFDSRIQLLEAPAEHYLTNETKNVIVDAFVKWRISDVAQYYRATGGDRLNATTRLSRIVNNALKNQISQRTVRDVIGGDRVAVMNAVRESVAEDVAGFGIDVVDVRIKRLDYAETISESIFQRMATERGAAAKKWRSEGQEESRIIRADADRQHKEIIAAAFREAEIIRGEGDAEAASIYAKAYGKNPEFYAFHRSLGAYREAFGSGQDVLILEPDSEFFKYFKDASGRGGR